MASDYHDILKPHLPDDITVKHWLIAYVVMLAAAVTSMVLLIASDGVGWESWKHDVQGTFINASVPIKLLGFGIYMSLCCTFLPMPTSWIVAAVATRDAAVGDGVLGTVAMVAIVGAAASTIANLNDYHLFTWILRHGKIAKLRNTRTYRKAALWFSRSPFWILVIFNLIPIPIDIIRMLAITYRYPRLPFALANFLGRLIRYTILAFVIYWWNLGWYAVVALLGLAVVLGGGRGLITLVRRFRRTNDSAVCVSESTEASQE